MSNGKHSDILDKLEMQAKSLVYTGRPVGAKMLREAAKVIKAQDKVIATLRKRK